MAYTAPEEIQSAVAPSQARRIAWFKALSGAAAAAVALIGCAVLLGWALDVPLLKSVFPGLITMKANTALAFLLAGASLWLLHLEHAGIAARRVARTGATAAAVLGLLNLTEYLFGLNLGIDQALFKDQVNALYTEFPGRMAPATTVEFLLLGLAIVLLDVEGRRDLRPSQLLAYLALLLPFVSLSGYASGVASVYPIGAFTPMALHTSIAFLALGIGVLAARPDLGLVRIFTSDHVGGASARYLLPAALLVPMLVNWMRITGEQLGLYDEPSGEVLVGLVVSGTWISVVTWHTMALDRADIERRALEEALRHAALHDPLTGLANRLLLSEELRRSVAQAARTHSRTGVMMVDLDDLKVVNDRFGHQVGDAVLIAAAERLRRAVRESDTVARYGGDEFVVLLENLSSEMDALTVAARILAVREDPLTVTGHTIRFSFSIGVATRQGRCVAEDILRAADRALLTAKREGKDRVVVAASED